MLNWVVGNIDSAAALVLIALFAGATIITSAMILKRRTTLEIHNEFELAKMKQRDAQSLAELQLNQNHESSLAKIAANRDVEIKRIDNNMITSHTSSTSSE